VPETGFEPQAFRIADYAAYYRRVRRSLEQSVETGATVETYPEPNPHCEVCRWRVHCDGRRRADEPRRWKLWKPAVISPAVQRGSACRGNVGVSETPFEPPPGFMPENATEDGT
jgi:hypothetical protein